MPAIPGMKGEGYYDRHSAAQAASIRLVHDWIEEAAAALTLTAEPRPITLADLGSSEGRNAIQMLQVAVQALRRRRPAQPIQTIFSDLPTNNFNRLFANLADPHLGGAFPAEVYPSVVAGSFYGRLFPPASVHLMTCSNAIVWLDKASSVPVRDFVVHRRPHPPRAGLTVSAEDDTAFRKQADGELVRFLENRAAELAPGGKLLVTTPADDEHRRCCDGLYDVLDDACRDLVAAGRLERARYEALVIPTCFRTLGEMLAPLDEPGSPVRGLFTVDRGATLDVPTPFVEAFQQTGDRIAYADAFTGFLRAFSEPVVRAVLVGTDGDAAVVDALFQRLHARLVAEPERYRFQYIIVAVLLTRT
jgi:hypothetical protein